MCKVSEHEKQVCAQSALNTLVCRLIKDYGHNEAYWLQLIYTSLFYHDIINTQTGYWGEGVLYHETMLLKELQSKGIVYNEVSSKGRMTKKAKDRSWLTIHIMNGLRVICHLTPADIGYIVQRTPIITFLINNYATLHQEGMLSNLLSIKDFLQYYGISIIIDRSLVVKRGFN